jgi:hypothetical protein
LLFKEFEKWTVFFGRGTFPLGACVEDCAFDSKNRNEPPALQKPEKSNFDSSQRCRRRLLKWCASASWCSARFKCLFAACGAFWATACSTKRRFSGAHHQFAHNGELQLVLALAVPFLGVSDFWLGVFEVALTVGTWGNPLAYAIVAVSGEGNALFVAAKEGPWGKLAEVLLMFVTAPAILTTLVIAIVGFARGNGNGNGNALSNAKKSK